MDPLLRATLLKLVLPLGIIAIVLVVSKVRGLSWKDDLGMRWPNPSSWPVWIGVWIAWVALGEVAIRVFGMETAAPWQAYPALIVVLRVAAIGIAGPASEELVMRGALLGKLRATRLGPLGAIAVVAAAWALMHYNYDPMTIGLIFTDGLVLGAARHYGQSIYLPIVMHMMGNLFSIYQSLSA